jgi:HD superfamily phosphodiesterase
MEQSIVEAAQQFATEKLKSELPNYVKYHDLGHTQTVANEVADLAKKEGVDENTIRVLEVAAWMHDLGYLQKVEGHEELSVQIAREFMNLHEVDVAEQELVTRLIRATALDRSASDKLEEIIKDADLAHLGLEFSEERTEMLRQEREILEDKPIKKMDWAKMNIEFFERNNYYTSAAKEKYGDKKQAVLDALKAKVKGQKKVSKKKDKKASSRGRGIETMFRVTLKNHMALSQIADNKANIMLSINAIIVSIVLTSLIPKLDNNTFLIWPSVLLLTVCVVSIIFATISTIPKVTSGASSLQAVRERKVNLLFFGNFYNLDLDDYIFGMKDMMQDDEYLYETLMKDLYFLGKVLNKKYKYLRVCYGVFMVGIILSVLAYLASFALMFEPI